VPLEYTFDLVTPDAADDVRRVAADAVAHAGGAGGIVATAPRRRRHGGRRRVRGRGLRTASRRARRWGAALLATAVCQPAGVGGADVQASDVRPSAAAAPAASLRIALNRHLREVTAASSAPLALDQVGAGSVVMLTEPVDVHYHDPAQPALAFAVPGARFVAINQAAGWVYGLTINPQRAAPLPATVAAARDLERRLRATGWRRVHAPPADDAAVRAWVASTDEVLTVGKYTAGAAALRLTLERTGQPSPSERLRGKQAESYFVNVRVIDMSRHDAYVALIVARARAQGVPVGSLRLSSFLRDPARP
jgi:hypothetical protein